MRQDVVRRLISQVYQARDGGALADLIDVRARAAMMDCIRVLALIAALPDGRLTVDELVSDELATAVRLTLHSPGRQVTLPVFGMYRVEGGRIVDARQWWDGRPIGPQPEPILDLDDIQGNIFPGFSKDNVALIGFRIADLAAAPVALAALSDEVATAAEVYAFGRLFAATRARRGREGAVQAVWCNVALTFPALRRLSPDADRFTDTAFRAGMPARMLAAGNPFGTTDLLLIVAADRAADIDREMVRLTELVAPGFEPAGRQRGQTLPGGLRGHEHFGFRDGVSQPGVRGRLPSFPYAPATARLSPSDPDEGKPGQQLVWPGEFVFGYPRQGADLRQPGPVADAGPSWAHNGSFLVYGRYRQDVGAFNRFVVDAAGALAAREPALAGLTPERLAAALMGRWRSGAPLVRAPEREDPALGADDRLNNNFTFRAARPADAAGPVPADPLGLVCPFAAHVRKANIRDDLSGGLAAAQRHRLLRRGIPYGPPGEDDTDRGLLFLAYQTSIERQFQFIVDRWLDDAALRVSGEGVDLVVGSSGNRTFGVPVREDGTARIVPIRSSAPLTVLTEGGYLFAPSVSALRGLAG